MSLHYARSVLLAMSGKRYTAGPRPVFLTCLPITADTALRLAKAFGTSEETRKAIAKDLAQVARVSA